MTIFYFTATGNSLYAAKTLGGKLYSIPQLLKEGQFEFADDSIGFVFPVYRSEEHTSELQSRYEI
ncbi:MAG: hypothetical protein LBC67_05905, partial [Spirochaetales bacterium]|nr:hypothetical protein [Spirochaetales bacterium]